MSEQDVVLKSIDSQHIMSIREIIPTPVYVGKLLSEAFAALGQQAIYPAAAPQAIYHDEEFKPTELDVEVAIPVANTIIQDLALPNGRVLTVCDLPVVQAAASVIHIGSYDALSTTYQALGKWIDANGYRIVGASREIYLKAADQNGDPIVEIQWPVEKATNE